MKLHFHNYGKWSDLIEARVSDYTMVQSRICETCGKIQIKKVSQPWNIWLSAKDIMQKLKEAL